MVENTDTSSHRFAGVPSLVFGLCLVQSPNKKSKHTLSTLALPRFDSQIQTWSFLWCGRSSHRCLSRQGVLHYRVGVGSFNVGRGIDVSRLNEKDQFRNGRNDGSTDSSVDMTGEVKLKALSDIEF